MNLRSNLITLTISALVFFSTSALSTSDSNKPDHVRSNSVQSASLTQGYSAIKIHSDILDEERELLIHLPSDYAISEKQYPVLYLLDGNRHLAHAILAEEILQGESLMPQSIIVAITNNRGTRRRDLSIGKANFLKFIKTEVINFVSEQYRTSGHRTLFGHSMAGAFTMDVLATQPELFDNFLAASPVIQMNDSELIEKYRELDLSGVKAKKTLYLTFGNSIAEGKNAADALTQFVELIDTQPTKNLSMQVVHLPNQVHMTTPYITAYEGLTYAFKDYQHPTYSGFKEYERRGKLQGLKNYYIKRADKYSISANVPERAIRNLGFAIFDDGYQSEGLRLLEGNVKNYPSSLRALNALAQIYEETDHPSKALATYRKAVIVAKKQSSANLEHFERQVKRLERSQTKS